MSYQKMRRNGNGTSVDGRRRHSTNSVHDFEPNGGGPPMLTDLHENTPLLSESYPKEYLKFLLSVLMLFLGALTDGFVIGYIHRYSVPQPQPLPDIIFQFIPQQEWAWKSADYSVMLCAMFSLILLFHKHWSIVLRRLCLIACLLYILRAAFLLCTYLPPPFNDKDERCLPANFSDNAWEYVKQAFGLVFTGGYSATDNRIMCGDTIYSGHSMVFLLVSLIVWHHCPELLYPYFPILTSILSTFGLTTVTISRQHYTIDVVVALFVTYATFYGYMVWVGRERDRRCFGTKPFTFRPLYYCFLFFEGNVAPGRIPPDLAWPMPFPLFLVKLFDKANDWAQSSAITNQNSNILDV